MITADPEHRGLRSTFAHAQNCAGRVDPPGWRERAEECRTVAEILGTKELREKMFEISADYERLADAVDKVTADTGADDPEVSAAR
jgi:hypothetical protein